MVGQLHATRAGAGGDRRAAAAPAIHPHADPPRRRPADARGRGLPRLRRRRRVGRTVSDDPDYQPAPAAPFDADQTLDRFLLDAGELLESLEIPHMVTGSFASSVHGEPRMTLDADLVIDPPNRGTLAKLVRVLQEHDFYVSPRAAAEAWASRRMFNAISNRTQYKLDLILTKDDPFDRERFARRTRESFSTGSLWVTTPEDIILGKLSWGRQMGGSERQARGRDRRARRSGRRPGRRLPRPLGGRTGADRRPRRGPGRGGPASAPIERAAPAGGSGGLPRGAAARNLRLPPDCRPGSPPPHAPRPTAAARMPTTRDYYEVLGVSRDADGDRREKGLPQAGRQISPGPRPQPRGDREVQGGRRGVRGPLRPRETRPLRPVRPRRK